MSNVQSKKKKKTGMQRSKKTGTIMRRKINQTDPEITQIIKLIDKDMKTAVIILHRFKKLESRLSMLNKGIENMKRLKLDY